MKEIRLETKITVYPLNEVPDEELPLVHAALKATEQSYAPYSKFHVGAAALLADGTIVTGSNQENARLSFRIVCRAGLLYPCRTPVSGYSGRCSGNSCGNGREAGGKYFALRCLPAGIDRNGATDMENL